MKVFIATLRNIGSLLFTGILLCGCNWPNYGVGGTDESFQYSRLSSIELSQRHHEPDVRQIAKSLDLLREQINQAWIGSGGKYRPAQMTLIEARWGRATREFAGHLYIDAAADLQIVEKMLQDLYQDLDHIPTKAAS